MKDIECPYCGHDFDVCNDDGHGYEEDKSHEERCPSCDKNFVFTTMISFTYSPAKADCLNGAPHRLELSNTYPKEHARLQCQDCDYSEKPK